MIMALLEKIESCDMVHDLYISAHFGKDVLIVPVFNAYLVTETASDRFPCCE